MHRPWRTGSVLCAIALLVAGCTSSGGGDENSTRVPTGVSSTDGKGGNGGKDGKGGKHNQKPGDGKPSKNRHHGGGSSSSSGPSAQPTRSNSPAPGRTTSSPRPTRSNRPGTSSSSAPQPKLPTVTVTPHNGLGAVQTVTVEGFNFKPNTLLAVAQCRDRGLDTGLPDCNINNVITYAPGAKVRSDANGHVGPVQITVRKTFKAVNCGVDKCLVAISEPSLRPDPEDEGDQYINFA